MFVISNTEEGKDFMAKFKIIPAASLFLGLVLLFSVVATAAKGQGWYCVRAKGHKQPSCDSNMRYIEDYDGYYIDRIHGDDCNEKVVYLTFDAGYENGNTEKILNVMKEKNVKGAFFVLGNLIEKNGDLIKRMTDEGHTVANHTYSHKNMTRVASYEAFCNELVRLEAAYQNLTGKEMAKYYRPPEGVFDKTTMEYASRAGYKTIFWSFAYADWDNENQPDAESAKKKILDNIHNGAVILLHPTSETNALIIGDIIDALKNDGYRFGTLDELTS